MKPNKSKKPRNPPSALKGVMQCSKMHRWTVVDLNPDRGHSECPVCSEKTTISKGLQSGQ